VYVFRAPLPCVCRLVGVRCCDGRRVWAACGEQAAAGTPKTLPLPLPLPLQVAAGAPKNPFGDAAPRDEAAYEAKKAAERAARAEERKKEQDDRKKKADRPEAPGGNWRDNAAPSQPRGRGAGGADRGGRGGGAAGRGGARDGERERGPPRDRAPAEAKAEAAPPAARAPKTSAPPEPKKPAKVVSLSVVLWPFALCMSRWLWTGGLFCFCLCVLGSVACMEYDERVA